MMTMAHCFRATEDFAMVMASCVACQLPEIPSIFHSNPASGTLLLASYCLPSPYIAGHYASYLIRWQNCSVVYASSKLIPTRLA